MIRILHISPSVQVKGGISTLLQYYKATDLPQKFDLVFLTSHKDGSRFFKLWVALFGFMRMLYLMFVGKVDVVHIHCGDIVSHYRKFIFFYIAKIFNKSIILHLHGALFIEQAINVHPFWKKMLSRFYSESDLVICLSESWSKDIGLMFPKSNRVVIPNGIPLPKESFALKDKSNEVIISFLGLIGPRKGIFDLLKVISQLVVLGMSVKLKIGGNGDIDKLYREIEELSLQDNVEYLGWITREQKVQLFNRTDIFVLPSYGEGMPMSILEAMSYSIPIISTQVGGIPELVKDGVSGCLTCPGDTEALFAMLNLLVKDESLRTKMGINARKTAESKHDINNIVQKIGHIYHNLCNIKKSKLE